MTTRFFPRLSLITAVAAALLLIGTPSQSHAQSIAVMVNGEPITHYDIEQRTKLNTLSHKAATKQQVIDELIDEKVKIKEAKRFGVDPSASDIDSAFAQMSTRMRTTPDALTKMLESHGIRTETLKARIRADMVWGSLVRGRFKESLQVGEKDVAAAVQVNADEKEKALTESFEYQMRPIVLIVPRGAPAAAMEVRRKEAEALRGRVQTCDDASALFKSMQNAAIRDPVVKTSADLPAPLRDLLDKTPIGHLTAPEVTKQGIEMVALCGRKPTTVDTPKKREVREKMFMEKYEKKQKTYLDEVRKAAMIEYR
jgi:peptidyl-prolyl cis-trans isomerase SurA